MRYLYWLEMLMQFLRLRWVSFVNSVDSARWKTPACRQPRHAKPSKEARPPKLLYFDGTQWRGTRRAQARLGRKSMAEREKRKRWLRKPCMARLKGVFFRFLKRVWRPTNGLPTVGPSFCPSVRSSAKVLSCLALSWAHWSTWALFSNQNMQIVTK